MGLLDILQGDPSQASPYNAMFPSQLLQQLQELQLAKGQAPSPQDAAAYGSMGVDPSAMPMPVPPPSPFPDVHQPQPPAPPASGFGAGAAPFSFAGAGSNAPTPQQMAPPAPPAPAPQAAAPAPGPAPGPMNANAGPQNAPLPVGNVMMPRIGSGFPAPGADDGEDDATPAAKPAAAPGAPAGPAPFSFGGVASNVGDRLEKAGRGFFGNMALGPIGALAGGLGALVTNKNTDPTAIAQEKMNLTAQALAKKGASPDEIQAAAQNPELMKALLGQYFGKDKFQPVTTKDALGNETKSAFDTNTGEFKTAGSTGGAGGAPGSGVSILAPGVKSYDANLSGDAYMAQFSPEVQAAAKSYMAGDVMPTGNARNNSIATFAKTVAQKYGMDTGTPVTDATYGAKRKMQTDLASSGNSTMGGILSNGESSFKHLAEYTVSAADQGNASHNFPLGGVIAHGQNYLGNALGGSDTQGKVKAINDNLGKYGAESTKFYAGTGGGVEERLNALKEMNATTTSGEEAAAYAEKEKGLMLDRLNTKFQEIRNTLGEERGNAEIAKHLPDIQKNIATIDANVARLRGQPASAATPGGTAGPPPGNYVWTPNGGLAGAK